MSENAVMLTGFSDYLLKIACFFGLSNVLRINMCSVKSKSRVSDLSQALCF